ncbi:hypothetical protein ACVBEQ_04465 [Nakamurella sp. GG22]
MAVQERHGVSPSSAPMGSGLPAGRMPPVPTSEFDGADVRGARRRRRAERRTRYRTTWWFPFLVLLMALSGCWTLLKADQLLAEKLIWPSQGAQFVEVGPVPEDTAATGGRVMVVVGGLNRKSGTGAAAALMPVLTVGHTRVFSLVYGSGINDQDLLDKFDALMSRLQPREVSFYGSSMGGDIALNLAAHTQEARVGYRQDLLTSLTAAGRPGAGEAPGGVAGSVAGDGASRADTPLVQRNEEVGSQAGRFSSILVLPDSALLSGAGSALIGAGGVAAAALGPIGVDDSGISGNEAPAGADPFGADPVEDQPVPPRLGVIYLDCSPLGADDVRDASRTQADAITALTEAIGTEGGVAVRLTAEVLGQQAQWSTGRLPFLDIRWTDLKFKIRQVWRDKIDAPGISTQLVKDQYGVIRRMDIDEVADSLGPGARIVYFRPENPADDHTIRVDRVESTFQALAADKGLDVRVVPIPDGHHASAESNPDTYRSAITAVNGGGT